MAPFSQSAALKSEIEAKLALRIPGALSPQIQQTLQFLASGVSQIDDLLGGGMPIGGISEFTGSASSGRTALAFSLLAEATLESACAYVDLEDCVDPRSAAAAGVLLRNLLWVRLATVVPQVAVPTGKTVPDQSLVVSASGGKLTAHGCSSHHPRTEMRGVDRALGKMRGQKAEARLEKMEGTPGSPNRSFGLAAASDEQVHYEHCNARRADDSDPIRQADNQAALEARQRSVTPLSLRSPLPKQEKPYRPWSRLEKAICATDQILQSGGFRVVVLDLASVPPKQALRIPSATWFRFRRAAQESDAILLLLTQTACARSSALCVLDCSSGIANSSNNLLSGLSQRAEVARQRLISPTVKKAPGRAVIWEATSPWMRAAGS